MDAVLSSFCFNTTKTDAVEHAGWSYGMPPVSFRSVGASFRPDYSICFLCDSFYVDELTVQRVSVDPMFAEHAALFEALRRSGRLRVVDYRDAIAEYRDVIEASARRDIAALAEWRDALLELVELWEEFSRLADRVRPENLTPHYRFGHESNIDELLFSLKFEMVKDMLGSQVRYNLRNWKKALPDDSREYTRRVVAPYLRHVSATLCLADCLNAVVHDWSDIGPLYRQKLMHSVRTTQLREQKRQDACRRLIEVMFPDFTPRSPKSLARALDDKRIDQLRRLVDDAVKGEQVFDSKFAADTLRDVLAGERLLGKYRNILGWVAMPISVIPWVGSIAEKGVQMAVEKVLKARVMSSHAWFLWLSDIDDPKKVRKSLR